MAAILNENGYGDLPIFKWCIGDKPPVVLPVRVLCCTGLASYGDITKIGIPSPASRSHHSPHPFTDDIEIGRASCRERGESSEVEGAGRRKKKGRAERGRDSEG